MKKILESIYSWCFVLCEMHLYSLQTMVRNEMPHFQNQGSRDSNVAVRDNFKFRICFSVWGDKNCTLYSLIAREGLGQGRAMKTRKENEPKWPSRRVPSWDVRTWLRERASWGHVIEA